MNLFDAIFTHDPLSTAIRFGRREITYGELRAETLKMAQVINSLNARSGDRVALLLHDSPEFVEAFIAACSLGAIAVPINMALRPAEQCSILHNSGATMAVIEADSCQTLLTYEPEKLRSLRNIVLVERAKQANELPRMPQIAMHDLKRMLSEVSETTQPEFSAPGSNDPAFILYTSGSTGEPKGAVHRQADILYTNQTFCREVLRVSPSDRLFSSSRLPFAYGLGNSFTFPLLNGATTILCSEKPSPDVIAAIFAEHRPTIFFGVPVVYNLLLEHHRSGKKFDCSSLRLCISAGEALPAHLGEEWERQFRVPVLDGIGSTEMLHMFMSNHEGEVRYGSSGKLLDGYEARLLDERGEPAAEGAEGNLWIKHEVLSMAGFVQAISTAATAMATGFTWVAVMIVSSRAGSGFLQLKLKVCCCDIPASRGQL